jgi:hypothetical protein
MIVFVRARLHEDEAAALAPSPSRRRLEWVVDIDDHDQDQDPGEAPSYHVVSSGDVAGVCLGFGLERDTSGAVVAHIARHDPARVLADVAAKRAVLDLCADVLPDRITSAADMARGVIVALACAFDQHPDFDPAWRDG